MKISSVLGPIDTRDMGLTLMHEHVVNIDWNFARAFPGFYDREATVEMFCEEMARKVGVACVPGTSFFNEKDVNDIVRLHFAKKDETLLSALDRLSTIREKMK